ncbi:MAG: ABC transporter ATP-binding protein [Acidimicrobiales bacterium]
MEAEILLEIAGVTRAYDGLAVLDGVDLTVSAGEAVIVMGPNGSGKSTLLRLAAGQDKPTTGEALYRGRPIDQDDLLVRNEVAVVGDGTCYPDLTVREHLELVLAAFGVREDREEMVGEALAAGRLEDRADAFAGQLSSGQRQQLLLAAALARPHELLVLDEPEQRLDPDARQDLAARLQAEAGAGVGVLMASHDLELARLLDASVLVLIGGKPKPVGPAATVLKGGVPW